MARRITGGIEVAGIDETIRAATAAKDEWGKAVLREIRGALRPMGSDIRKRFRGLGGTGDRVAGTVRTTVIAKGATVRMGNAKHPYSLGREFGARRKQTRLHTRRVQSGKNATRTVGGGTTRVFVSRIDYTSPNIFNSWTGNQFALGESDGRLVIEEESGRAYYPGIGAGGGKIYEALSKVAVRTIDAFPDETGKARSVASSGGGAAKLNEFLTSNGL
jgi:hypothetical protein